jgi:hypothetical protein
MARALRGREGIVTVAHRKWGHVCFFAGALSPAAENRNMFDFRKPPRKSEAPQSKSKHVPIFTKPSD